MSKDLIDLLLDRIFDDAWVGKRGEKLTERELKLVQLFGRKGKVLRNIYLPKDNGETSEVDVVFITPKGIFVFESKNYSGWIFGDEKSQKWTVMLPNKQKNQFYNPVLQNKTHVKWMRNYVGDDIPLFSIIVFSERCELKKVTVESSNVKVIKRDRTYAAVREIWDESPDVVSEEKIIELYDNLSKLTNVDEAVKAAHRDSINQKYKKEVEDRDVPQRTEHEELVCPRCGSTLVLRTAKKGENAGNQFYGCSAFPKCRYIKKYRMLID